MSLLNDGLFYFLNNEYQVFTEQWQSTLAFAGFLLVSIAVSYLLGSINSAIIISRFIYGEDVRTKGSGNAGLTNMLRNYGKKGAALTLLGDAVKTILAILITAIFFGFHYNSGVSLSYGLCYLSGLSVAIGHIFPIYYNFKGGKGVLVSAVTALILTPVPALILISLFAIIVAITRYVSLGSITVGTLFPIVVYLYARFIVGVQSVSWSLIVCTVLIAVVIVWCHRANIKRLLSGTENKLSFKKKTNEEK